MAKPGDVLEHPVTGEQIVFLETGKETANTLLKAEVIMKAHGFVAAEHIHPLQEERFDVLSGRVRFRVKGIESELSKGQSAVVPPGTPHVWWNDGDEEARVLVEVRPALRFDEFFETFFGLAQAGKVNPKTGLPNPLLLALIMREFKEEIRVTQPPESVQGLLFGILGFFGRLAGYQGTYQYPR
jgi:quercetin dioxygenase-like cupin family protein